MPGRVDKAAGGQYPMPDRESRDMQPTLKTAKYNLGQIVRHREHPFRGVVFDVDPEFANTEEWYESIPEEARPARNQPFYHLYAETEATY